MQSWGSGEKYTFIDNLALAIELGDYNTDFKWIDIQNKSEKEIVELIKK